MLLNLLRSLLIFKLGSAENVTCDLIHIHKSIGDSLLLYSLPLCLDKDWIDKWNTQFWPTFDDIWKSYMKFKYLLPNIKESSSSW